MKYISPEMTREDYISNELKKVAYLDKFKKFMDGQENGLAQIGIEVLHRLIELVAVTRIKETETLTEIASGTLLVSTAGTAVQFATIEIRQGYYLKIKALGTNTNNAYVASSVPEVGNTTRFVLDAGEDVDLDIRNANVLFIDVDTDGEGITWIVLAK